MPSAHRDIGPSGVEISFDEASHRYTSVIDGKTMDYMSVTSFVHLFKPPFDAQSAAERVSAKTGEDVSDILAKWDAKREHACSFGTRVHEVCEDVMLGRRIRNTPTDEERPYFKSAWDAAKFVRENCSSVFGVEKILFDVGLRLAGTSDLITRDFDGAFHIWDWKSNERIRRDSQYGTKMLFPLDGLDDCELNTYSLQLGVYQYIMERAGYVPRETLFRRSIVHIRADGYEVVNLRGMDLEVRDAIIHGIVSIPGVRK